MHVILDVNNEVKGIKGVEEEDAAVVVAVVEVEVEDVDALIIVIVGGKLVKKKKGYIYTYTN